MNTEIEIRDWRVIDIYYNEADEEKVQKVIEQYHKKGYKYQQTDNGAGKYDNCAQLITDTKISTKKLKQ